MKIGCSWDLFWSKLNFAIFVTRKLMLILVDMDRDDHELYIGTKNSIIGPLL